MYLSVKVVGVEKNILAWRGQGSCIERDYMELNKGEFVAFIGPQAPAKRRAKPIGVLDKPRKGKSYVDNVDLNDAKRAGANQASARHNRLHLPILQPHLSALSIRKRRVAPCLSQGYPPRNGKHVQRNFFKMVGLADRMYHRLTNSAEANSSVLQSCVPLLIVRQ